MPDLGEAFFDEAIKNQPLPTQPPAPTDAGAPTAPSPAQPGANGDFGEAFFEEAAGGAAGRQGSPPPAPLAQVQSSQAAAAQADSTGSLALPMGIDDATIDPSTLGKASVAAGLGAAKGVFAAKDCFATGAGLFYDQPSEAQRSSVRQWVDGESASMGTQNGEAYSLTEGLAQGAIGLLGAGKLAWGGAAIKAAAGAIGTAASFEPHAANFMNLAQSIPGMDGPVTRFLASNEGDSAFVGYMKNALVSLGVEGAALGLFTGTAAALKAIRGGDQAAIDAASADLEKALAAHTQPNGPPDASPAPTAGGLQAKLEEMPQPLSPDAVPMERILGGWEADEKALIKYGSWEAAIADGHTFGGDDKIPWQVLATGADGNPSSSMDAFMSRVSAGYAKLGDDLKGGEVQTDAANMAAVERRAQLWNEDPSALIGALEAAGQRAGSLRADMTAAYAIAQRCMQDTWTMASRINIGDFSEWGGSQAAAHAALKEQTGVAATLLASAQSIRANSARAMRGLRSEFALDPMLVRNLASLDGDSLVSALTSTRGDPVALKAALQPGLLTRLAEGTQLYLVNNLIWNPLTHATIFASNSWQALARPAMRAAGSLANGTANSVGQEALKSYHFMLSSAPDAFRSAMQAFRTGDSILSPHSLTAAGDIAGGGAQGATALGQSIAQRAFGPWDSFQNIMGNVLLAGQKTLTFPTRAVGFQDELVKQIVYRGKVQAKAMVGGAAQGLAGDELGQYVKGKLYDSFDAYGRATDGEALREAKTATFQNDLNPTGHFLDLKYPTGGYIAQRALQGNPLGRILVPFVRTPVNLYRQGAQLTFGLNMIQAEYRDAIRGVLGAERQAQAAGQMGMSALIAGTAATLAYQGLITGNAPRDPKLAREAEADGWRPNSIVIPHRDGTKTYIPFDRFDPVAMPFAIAADIVNVLKSDAPADQRKGESMAQALGLALYKSVTDKLYLENVSRTIDFAMDPEKHGGEYLGGMASNFVPAASLLHLVNPDPSMREAHDFASAMLDKVPGLSSQFPARRDWAGDPITVHKGLWHDTPADSANAEIERLALTQQASIGAPSSQTRGKADLRDIQLAGNADPEAKGMNAYDRFQELAGHPEQMPGAPPNAKSLRQAIAELVQSPVYQRMPDGSADTQGTKLATLTRVVSAYREGARRFMAADSNVRAQEYAEQFRVAKELGYATPAMPTPTNRADGLINALGKAFGISGMRAPSAVTPQ